MLGSWRGKKARDAEGYEAASLLRDSCGCPAGVRVSVRGSAAGGARRRTTTAILVPWCVDKGLQMKVSAFSSLCGVCDSVGEGDWFPSGVRDPRTGEMPHDNFICNRCQEESRSLRIVGKGLDRYERLRRGVRTR